ncbi:methyl-accepting chemotaxis protein [Acidaminobacter sp. JC074]|uniref:methyl-accepting chemotaxis protein n=1 Tax=Acidaminobacter sp. JC074 TaxID=2530199 RepID=UPI001F0E784B|nr:methyl-accepting chemotaxis protein [Acidaminobacter sp. JC074]MCH4889565.1 methyl-accepting chemotaxis protein [Acidaminobacter sp. JC074]
MKRRSFGFKILIMTLLIVLVSNLVLTVTNIVSSRALLFNEMKQEGYLIAEEILMGMEEAEDFEAAIDDQLAGKILMASETLNFTDESNWSNAYFKDMVKRLGVTEINVIGRDRKIDYSNIEAYMDWEYPKGHAMDLVFDNKQSSYMEDIRINPVDSLYYKYGGIKLDNGYYVQIGISAEEIEALKEAFSVSSLLEDAMMMDNITYALLLDDTGTAIYGTESMIGTTYTDDVTLNALKGIRGAATWKDPETGDLSYDIQVPVYEGEKLSGSLAIGLSLKTAEETVFRSLIQSIIITIGVIIVCTIIVLFISKKLVKPLNYLEGLMTDMAEGDFTLQVDDKVMNNGDEIGAISQSLESMRVQLSHLIGSVKSNAIELSESTDSLSRIMEETSISVGENAQAIEAIATTSNEQAHNAEVISKNSSVLGENIDTSKTLVVHANESVTQASDLSNLGQDRIVKLDAVTKETNEVAINIEKGVVEVDKAIENMINFVDTIKAISEQTNLLALNASIEAARAGEAGKGFAVVAEEIRKLSIGTNDATEQINDLIQNVKQKALVSVKEAGDVKNLSLRQGDALKEVMDVFKEISGSLNNLVDKMEGVMSTTHVVEEMKNDIVLAIDKMSLSTETASATYEEISASTEEQTASIQEIASLAIKNQEMADSLQADVNKFKI